MNLEHTSKFNCYVLVSFGRPYGRFVLVPFWKYNLDRIHPLDRVKFFRYNRRQINKVKKQTRQYVRINGMDNFRDILKDYIGTVKVEDLPNDLLMGHCPVIPARMLNG